MSEPKAWQCPACQAWQAPHVDQHRCDPPSGGVAVRPVVAPLLAAGHQHAPVPADRHRGTGYHLLERYRRRGGGGGAGTFPGDSVTVTAANASAWRDGTLTLAPGQPRPACNPYGDCGHNSCAVLARPGLALVTDPAA